ncbi:hypothetical protein M0R04_07720 [Candidatus Dojkabacteria bacterium]|jgi:hypothetical protein|nr:hypothetical protein [Candidatus Dojkabacteria bacterium]
MTKTWVYDNTEIKRTKRTASKKLPSGKVDLLVEITPLHQITGSWHKWVRESDLYEIDGEAE